jgi:hypothetical protein
VVGIQRNGLGELLARGLRATRIGEQAAEVVVRDRLAVAEFDGATDPALGIVEIALRVAASCCARRRNSCSASRRRPAW